MIDKNIPIDQKLVKQLLSQKMTAYAINRIYAIPISVILAIKRGEDKPFYRKRTKGKIPKKDLCTRCGIRKKGEGLRFLCPLCFQKGEE